MTHAFAESRDHPYTRTGGSDRSLVILSLFAKTRYRLEVWRGGLGEHHMQGAGTLDPVRVVES